MINLITNRAYQLITDHPELDINDALAMAIEEQRDTALAANIAQAFVVCLLLGLALLLTVSR